ncbi:hypothetical protein TREMEDRAFT_63322 [Tremella mesenterica DSM 1558]|uniref:uncharacterized protein n=1 Tax=Tremella mesenterica (strain ATCC 24925 / CBS 8224 / DSM 1558 / NBRC 9311 / NRRL Y-6157 / RJB 2259-6 / UBC 559-6) TaxID=578456 RepID=UPI0003F48CFB|nr:uncharacterized protein TREMEDRAFT_63322 [Tremella mesenterica DSM 1558]EIW68854.1 hypothetical protein TREMEDRAFT_63322 [Tremella mesenterica DSM 1558]
MSSRPELNAHKFFADRFAAVLAQQGNSPRHVSSMGFGALAITDGSPSAAAASAAVPSATASPVAVTTPLSSGQQEVRPAPVGLPHPSGRTATVVEIDDDDDEEMDGARRGEETGVLVDDGEKGGADEDDEMGAVDEDEEILSVDLGDPALFEDRETWVSELEKLSPVRDNEGSPEFRVRLQTSFGKKRVAYQEKMDALAEIKAEKRRRSPSAHDEVTPPSAKRVKETPRSSTGQAELFPSPSHEPGSARKASLREQDRLWKLFIDERERWEVASIEESCDRCRREIITYVRAKWPCLRPVKPHNRGSRCASCTSGPCSFCPPNTARDIPPRPSAPLGPPYTPSAAVRRRLPTAQDGEYPSRSPSANFSSPGPTSPSPAARRLPNSPVAGPSRLPATPSAGPSRRTPRRASSAALRPSTPVAGPSRLPATPSAVPSRPSRSRPTPVSTQEDFSSSLPPALGTRSRQPSVPPASGLSTPAPPVKTPPKSSKGKGKNKKAVQFEPAVVEDESTQLPGEILPSLDHPTIALDPRIPEEDKQLATFRSVIIGLTTQLQANRRDTAKLVEYCVKLVSAMNTLSRTMATLVNSSDIGPLGRTELARVSRELTTDMSDFYRNLFDSPYLLNPTEYMLPPTLDWLRPSQPARLSSQDGAFLDILTLPADCLRTLRQLWKSPSLSVARDPALHSAHILAFNTAWKETRALRRAVGPKVTESSSGSGPAPGNEEQGGSSQQ